MFTRRLTVQTVAATTQFFGSTAGGAVLVATNTSRANLKIQPLLDGLRISPIGSVNGSAMLVATLATFEAPDGYTGALYGSPNGAATSPVALWESSY